MKYLAKIIGFFKTLGRPFPVRDWYITLSVAGILSLALIALSVYLFIGIQSGIIIAPKGGEQAPTINVSRENLNSTLEKYNARALNFEVGNYPVPNVGDPAR
jgi:hypothetical protein